LEAWKSTGCSVEPLTPVPLHPEGREACTLFFTTTTEGPVYVKLQCNVIPDEEE
jgi:hypothetical protein